MSDNNERKIEELKQCAQFILLQSEVIFRRSGEDKLADLYQKAREMINLGNWLIPSDTLEHSLRINMMKLDNQTKMYLERELQGITGITTQEWRKRKGTTGGPIGDA